MEPLPVGPWAGPAAATAPGRAAGPVALGAWPRRPYGKQLLTPGTRVAALPQRTGDLSSFVGCLAAAATAALARRGLAATRLDRRRPPHDRWRLETGPAMQGRLEADLYKNFDEYADDEAEVLGEGTGLASRGAERWVGQVKSYDKLRGEGLITCGRSPEDVHFTNESLPKALPMGFHKPKGMHVEFDVGETRSGKFTAHNMQFWTSNTFADLGLVSEVCEGAATALGIDCRDNPEAPTLITPAPVQMAAIPKILAGDDLVIAAETGSGKSLAYMLPMVQKVREKADARMMDYGLSHQWGTPVGLIVCPTRELAVQAARTVKLITCRAKLRVRVVYGGTGTLKKQTREVSQNVDLLIATPARLLKLYRESHVKFYDLEYIAIDEADFMLTQGFADLHELLAEISMKSNHRDHLHFTLITASITRPLWKQFQEEPRWSKLRVLESKSLHSPQANCSHRMLLMKGRDKMLQLISLLSPELYGRVPPKQTIVFCNNVLSCRSVYHKLKGAFTRRNAQRFIGVLHKDLQADKRKESLAAFTRGELHVLVCTDIAQRGLDLPRIGHIINFDFPLNSIDYLHRAGRTARFGEPGKVTSLVKKGDKHLARAIERSCQLGRPINQLSGDKRDYLRGGALADLFAHQPRATGADKGLPPPKPYDGSLR